MQIDIVNNKMTITFNTSKVVISDEHEEAYFESLLWPQPGPKKEVKFKLRHTGSYVYMNPCKAVNRLDARKELYKGLFKPVDYQCNLCSLWHRLDLMHIPIFTPDLCVAMGDGVLASESSETETSSSESETET